MVIALPLVLLVSLAVLFVWGLFWPRGQWRVLVAWSYRDPHGNEPSGAAFGVYRAIAGVGVVVLAVSGFVAWQSYLAALPVEEPPPSAMQRMWGEEPLVVNRVVTSVGAASNELLYVAPIAYQSVDGERRQPPYLYSLATLELPEGDTAGGIIGRAPSPGYAALDFANLVVLVEGDPNCIPRQAVVVENAESVEVAVYYGRPDNPDGTPNADGIGACEPSPRDRVPLLLPIQLSDELGGRLVTAIDGEVLRKAPVVTD